MVIALAALTAVTMAGCGKSEKQAQSATLVRTMEVIRRDTPIVYDYTGFMQAVESVSLQAKVGGQVVGKYFKGGEKVTPGQLLYTIDPRTYRADVLNAQAGLANARAELIKANQDLERYTKLYEQIGRASCRERVYVLV